MSWLGDGECDSACNNAACDYDNGDCSSSSSSTSSSSTSNSLPSSGGASSSDGDIECVCNGKTNDRGDGGSDCATIYEGSSYPDDNGKAYCYVDEGKCSGAHSSQLITGSEWSVTPCQSDSLPSSSNKESDGSSCDLDSDCTSGTCLGSNCCNTKGKSEGCTDCDTDGDCATCSANYYNSGYQCYPCSSGTTSPSGSTSSRDCSFTPDATIKVSDEPLLLAQVKKDTKIRSSSFSAATGTKGGTSAYVAAACNSVSEIDSNGNSLWPLEVRWEAQDFPGGDSESAGSRYFKPSSTSDWDYCDVMSKAHMNDNMLWSTDVDGPFTLENGRYDHYGGGGGNRVSWGGTCSHCIGGYYKRWNFEYSIYSAAGYTSDSAGSIIDSESDDFCDIATDCSQTKMQDMAECVEDTAFTERSDETSDEDDMCDAIKEVLQCYDACVCRKSCFQDQIKELKEMCNIKTCSLKDSLSGGLDNRRSIFCGLSLMWLVTIVLI